MAGIYIHIPYCKKICYYCDFHFSVNLKTKEQMIEAIKKEIVKQKNYLDGESIETIYFGGGTPSVLSAVEINSIVDTITRNYVLAENIEFTLEANPDDLTKEYLYLLKKETGVNRLSIGIQSFYDDDLQLMNRRHTGEEAINSLKRVFDCGFDNVTIDLIYALPKSNIERLLHNLDIAMQFDINHISTYCLTIEKQTAFNHFINKKIIESVDESESYEQFEVICKYLKDRCFNHYEISNFAREGYYSRHNLSYWQQKKYLGIGPSAHSFNLSQRHWNVANNLKYISALSDDSLAIEYTEDIDKDTRYNEYVMTSLRTMWGMDLAYLESEYGQNIYKYCLQNAAKYVKSKNIVIDNNHMILTDSGQFISNTIMSDLFIIK